LLWSHLRGRQQEGRKFHRQFAIAPYVVDFVCWTERLAIEIDGGQHDASDGREVERTRWLRAQGFSVLRFWNNEVLENVSGVLAAIAGTFGAPRPHPDPLPVGEGAKNPSSWGEGGAKRG
jgi:type I restriction enzyme M protein